MEIVIFEIAFVTILMVILLTMFCDDDRLNSFWRFAPYLVGALIGAYVGVGLNPLFHPLVTKYLRFIDNVLIGGGLKKGADALFPFRLFLVYFGIPSLGMFMGIASVWWMRRDQSSNDQ